MDIDMPVMNGFECLKWLKQHNDFKNIPVVILTEFNNPEEKELAYSLGASFPIFLYSKRTFQICSIAISCE